MADSIYPYTPFVYLIGWSRLNKWYIGSRSSITENAHPSQLWTSYYTSSKHVKRFAKKNGDPDVIMVLKTFTDSISTLNYEHKVLRRLNVKGRKDFLNRSNGLGDTHGDTTDAKWIRNHLDSKQATKQKLINLNDPVPDGWYYGGLSRLKIRNHEDPSLATKLKFLKSGEHLPDGWYYGGLSRLKIRNHEDPSLATKVKFLKSGEHLPDGWCYGGIPANKGMKRIRNHVDPKQATEQKMINSDDPIQEGWYLGGLSVKWIRNHHDPKKATKEKWHDSNEPVPEGWCYGKLERKRIRNHHDPNQATKTKRIKYNDPIPDGWYPGDPARSVRKHSTDHKTKLKISHSIGIWITPFGTFISANEAARNAPYAIGSKYIRKYCKDENDRIITKRSLSKARYLRESFDPEDIIGKTFAEIGFGFEPNPDS